MKKRLSTGLLLILCLGAAGLGVPMTQIWYSAEELDGGRWQYNYEVANISLTYPGLPPIDRPIEQFTIWFGYGLYDNLAVETPDTPTGWDQVVWQPESVLLDDGGYDAKALGPGIDIGQSLNGFAVSFDWLGEGEPWWWCYEIIDPHTFERLDWGCIPEPATLLLLTIGAIRLSPRRHKGAKNS